MDSTLDLQPLWLSPRGASGPLPALEDPWGPAHRPDWAARGLIIWPRGGQWRQLRLTLVCPEPWRRLGHERAVARLCLRWWADAMALRVDGEAVHGGDLFDTSCRWPLPGRWWAGEPLELELRLRSPCHDDGALIHSRLELEPLDPADPDGLLAPTLEALACLRRQRGRPSEPPAGSVQILGHAHLDLAWLWPVADTWRAAERTFVSTLALMERFPQLHFGHSTPALYAWLERQRPALFARIRAAMRAGRWEPLNGPWVETDCVLIDTASLLRQFQEGQHYSRRVFPEWRHNLAWLPDSFGFAAGLPAVAAATGVRWFCTHKLAWNATNPFPHRLFRWRSRCGSEVLALMTAAIGTDGDPLAIETHRLDWQRATGLADALWLPGVGDHGGGPTAELLEQLALWQRQPAAAAQHHGSLRSYLERLEPLASQLPVWRDELYLELHRGCATSRPDQKRHNRTLERLLREAELARSLLLAGADSAPADAAQAVAATQAFAAMQAIATGQPAEAHPPAVVDPAADPLAAASRPVAASQAAALALAAVDAGPPVVLSAAVAAATGGLVQSAVVAQKAGGEPAAAWGQGGCAVQPGAGGEPAIDWRPLLFQQFHDILPGTSIPEVFEQAEPQWRAARRRSCRQRDQDLLALLDGVGAAVASAGVAGAQPASSGSAGSPQVSSRQESAVAEAASPQTALLEKVLPKGDPPQIALMETALLEAELPRRALPETALPETALPQPGLLETLLPATAGRETLVPQAASPESVLQGTLSPPTLEAAPERATMGSAAAPQAEGAQATGPLANPPVTGSSRELRRAGGGAAGEQAMGQLWWAAQLQALPAATRTVRLPAGDWSLIQADGRDSALPQQSAAEGGVWIQLPVPAGVAALALRRRIMAAPGMPGRSAALAVPEQAGQGAAPVVSLPTQTAAQLRPSQRETSPTAPPPPSRRPDDGSPSLAAAPAASAAQPGDRPAEPVTAARQPPRAAGPQQRQGEIPASAASAPARLADGAPPPLAATQPPPPPLHAVHLSPAAELGPDHWRFGNGLLEVMVGPAGVEQVFAGATAGPVAGLLAAPLRWQRWADRGEFWDAWDLAADHRRHPLPWDWQGAPELISAGPLAVQFRWRGLVGASPVRLELRLLAGCPWLELVLCQHWHQRHELLQLEIPLARPAERWAADTSAGVIERPAEARTPREQARWEVPAISWLAAAELAVLLDGPQGVSGAADRLSVSLLRAPTWPDPGADNGWQRQRLGLMAAPAGWRSARVPQQARRLREPLWLRPSLAASAPASALRSSLWPVVPALADDLRLVGLRPAAEQATLVADSPTLAADASSPGLSALSLGADLSPPHAPHGSGFLAASPGPEQAGAAQSGGRRPGGGQPGSELSGCEKSGAETFGGDQPPTEPTGSELPESDQPQPEPPSSERRCAADLVLSVQNEGPCRRRLELGAGWRVLERLDGLDRPWAESGDSLIVAPWQLAFWRIRRRGARR